MVRKDTPYPVGTIKLTWIDPEDYSLLNGQMFDSIEDAEKFANENEIGSNWLIFKLVTTNGNRYEWKVLPYGKQDTYKNAVQLFNSKIIKFLIVAVVLLGSYYVVTSLRDNWKAR